MVDLHCHILPGLDDGPRNLDESVAMIAAASSAGTTDLVATPHANSRYSFSEDAVRDGLGALAAASGETMRLHYGCELHLSVANIQDALLHAGKYTINHKNYLLVELPEFWTESSMAEVLSRFRRQGILPVIAHPERNALARGRIQALRQWVRAECFIQVTGQSLLGRFGARAKACCTGLLSESLVHFVASDAHDSSNRTPCLAEAYRYVLRHFGEGTAERLFVDNPTAALDGLPLGQTPALFARQERKWYRPWV